MAKRFLNDLGQNSKREIAVITDAFPPMRTSAAIQIRDLALELCTFDVRPIVLVPSPEQNVPWIVEEFNEVTVLRLKAFKTKDINYVMRTINELLMPFCMLHNLKKSPFKDTKWSGIVWYSPSIFWGPLVKSLKKHAACKSYLILRDIFPEWAVDMGLMRRSLPYHFFKKIELFQYRVADVIGVQSPGNLNYFKKKIQTLAKIEVLQNWLANGPNIASTIKIADTNLSGRKIFVYAGNMGLAQGMDILLALATRLAYRKDIGFVFVGRGSEALRLKQVSISNGLDNTLFFDEIDPYEIPDLYKQCHVGMIALDKRHQTHNIPGKFLTYLQSGLPVLACVNSGNDIEKLIVEHDVGKVCISHQVEELMQLAISLVEENTLDREIKCKRLFQSLFSSSSCAKQILENLLH
ncbi:glycosyltransferase family 4 protein [Undibacterium sp. WLHG33]|uniref:glycosyltransferase family 4 protein n=1 Tax=Undibacterium sp. WLHG33 TaxID=3412482 RepID=UPI003C30ABD5